MPHNGAWWRCERFRVRLAMGIVGMVLWGLWGPGEYRFEGVLVAVDLY
jgi:hypothetical protein